jgi:Tol biopolymer transport system component
MKGSRALAVALCVLAAGDLSASGAAAPAVGRIVFSANPNEPGALGWQLFVVRGDGAGVRRLTRVPGDVSPSWSPSGTELVFERCCGPSRIWRVRADGRRARALTSPRRDLRNPDWSRRGGLIAYEDRTGDDVDLYIMRSDGRGHRRLTRTRGWDEDPAWSPDSRRIAFSHEVTPGESDYDLFVVDRDGTKRQRLTSTADAAEYGAEWSPDGSRIAFWRRDDKGDSVVVLDVATGITRRLTPPRANDISPVWSPGGDQIAFVSGVDSPQIWVMKADGSDRRPLVRGPFSQPMGLDWTS